MSNPLRIGVDASELLGSATGVGRYLGELMRRWLARHDRERRRFVLYSPERLPFCVPHDAGEVHVVGTGRGTWWEQTSLPRVLRGDQLDVFFAPAYTAPLWLPCRLAVTIHDISFVAHPEWFRVREGLRRRWLTGRAADTASVVFTDSEFSRSEIERHLHVPPSRIRVIPPGISPISTPVAQGFPAEPLILFVGSLFNRRRLPDLITAFSRIATDLPAARLVIVGDDRTWPPQDLPAVAVDRGVEDRVELRSYVGAEELADLYARASVFAFLSEYEGFGLTPLEALSAGVPILVLDTPVAHEAYADAAVYVQPDDIRGTADALRLLLTSETTRRHYLGRAPSVLARYSWDTAAARTLEHLDRIAAR